MARLHAIGRRTKEKYARVLERAFGNREPSFVPDLSSGGRSGGEWPERSRSILRAAILRYWTSKGDPERGERIAGGIEAIAIDIVEKPRPTEEETKRFERELRIRQRVGSKAATICFFVMQTGCRVEGALTMTPENLRYALKHNQLAIEEKGQKTRYVPVFERTRPEIQRLLEMKGNLPHSKAEAASFKHPPPWHVLGHLLAGPASTFATQRNLLDRFIKRVALDAGLDVSQWSPHTLRHVYASRLTRGGAPLPVVQRALGHRFPSTTVKYIHTTAEDIGAFGRFV